MKATIFRLGKAALALACAAGLIVAGSPLAQSEETSIARTSVEQGVGVASTGLLADSPVTVAGAPVDGTIGAETAFATTTPASESALVSESAPESESEPAGAGERSAAAGPQADVHVETVRVTGGIATMQVSGTITDGTGVDKPMDSLMLHKRGTRAEVSEVVSARLDGKEAVGEIFDFQPQELKGTFGLSDKDAKYPQILRISLLPTRNGDAKESVVGKKFSATYKVSAGDEGAQWTVLPSDAAFLPEFTVDSGPGATVAQGDGQPESDIVVKKSAEPPSNGQQVMRMEATLSDVEGLKNDPVEFYFRWEGDPSQKISVISSNFLDSYDPSAPYYGHGDQKYNPRFFVHKYSAKQMQIFGIPAAEAKESEVVQVIVDLKDHSNLPAVKDKVAFSYAIPNTPENRGAGWKLLRFDPPTVVSADLPPLEGYLDTDLNSSNDYLQDPDDPHNFLSHIDTNVETAKEVFNYRRSESDGLLADMTHRSDFLTNLPKPKRKEGFEVTGNYPHGQWDRAHERLDENGSIYNYLWCADSYGIASPHDDDPGLDEDFRNSRKDVVWRRGLGESAKDLQYAASTCRQFADDEQGRYFSRGHVQRMEGTADGHVIRSESFTIGGPDGGVWYGGDFGFVSVDSSARMLQSAEVSADTAIRIQVKGILDTKGWKFKRLSYADGMQKYLLVHPTKEFGLMVEPSANGIAHLHFLNLEGMNNFAKEIRGLDSPKYRFGVKIPPNTPIKISYGTREIGTPVENFEAVSISYGHFVPFFAARELKQPSLAIEKDVIKNSSGLVPDPTKIDYTIKVSNKEPGATDVRFRLTDTLGFPARAGVEKVVLVDGEVSPPKEYALKEDPQSSGRYLVDRRKLPDGHPYKNSAYTQNDEFFYIPAGASYTFKIRVYTKGDFTKVAEGKTACNGKPGSGFFNRASVEAPGIEPVHDSACAPIPALPGLSITKDFVKFQKVPQSPELWQAVYKVVVGNSGQGSVDRTVKLTDAPSFPADAHISKVAVKFGKSLAESGEEKEVTSGADNEYTLRENLDVPSNSSVTAFVTVTFTKPGPYPQNDASLSALACAEKDAEDKLHHGAYNVATVTVDGQQLSDDSCKAIPQKPTTAVVVQKIGFDGHPVSVDEDWQFEIYRADANWMPENGTAIHFISEDRAENTRSTADDALTEGNYLLVETKAPPGYELLAQPVRLQVFTVGMTTVRIKQPQDSVSEDVEICEPKTVRVKDVTQAELPLTGGVGVFWFLAGGLVFLGAAWVLNRRRG